MGFKLSDVIIETQVSDSKNCYVQMNKTHLDFAIGSVVKRKCGIYGGFTKCIVVGHTKAPPHRIFGGVTFVNTIDLDDGLDIENLPTSLQSL